MVLSRSVLSGIVLPSRAPSTEGGGLKQLALEDNYVVIEFRCW